MSPHGILKAAGAILGAVLVLCASAFAAEVSLNAGEVGGSIWVEIPDARNGFRLDADPLQPGACRLQVPGLRLSPEEAAKRLSGLPSAGFQLAESGDAATLFLPVPAGSLQSVSRLDGGWRLSFVPQTAEHLNEYRLGTRDQIEVTVFGHEDLTRTETVPPSGVVTFPLIDAIRVAGRTVGELEEEIEQRLAADFLVNPQVNVRVTAYESQWVNVVGLVKSPGKQPIKGRSTLIDVLTAAGGLTDAAGSQIVVTRAMAGGSQVSVDRDDLFSEHNESFNLVLSHGDIVDVQEQEVFYIQGEVARPGSYPLERGYTLLKAISVAGGFSQWADRKEVDLIRSEDGEQKKMVVNLKAIAQRKTQDINLLPEDIIIVKRRLL